MKPGSTWIVYHHPLRNADAYRQHPQLRVGPGPHIANGPAVTICDPAVAACSSDFTIQADGSATHVVADVQGYFRNLRAEQLPAPANPNQVAILRWYAANQTAAFPVGSLPMGVAFDGANIWVANSGSGTVSKR